MKNQHAISSQPQLHFFTFWVGVIFLSLTLKSTIGHSKLQSETSLNSKTEKMIKSSREQQFKNLGESSVVQTKQKLSKKSLYEELTGQKRKMSELEKIQFIIESARNAKFKKDYATAIKRYNTLILKFPRSIYLKQAYLDKAEIYQEMGLIEQAQFNLGQAKKYSVIKSIKVDSKQNLRSKVSAKASTNKAL